MTENPSPTPVVAVAPDADKGVLHIATCPMCHTTAPLTQTAVDSGGAWRCVRCGQQWDDIRLAAVAAYAAWVLERDAISATAVRGR